MVLSQSGYAEVTLYFDSITLNDIGEMFMINLEHVDVESGVNVHTTPSIVTLDLLGKKNSKFCMSSTHIRYGTQDTLFLYSSSSTAIMCYIRCFVQ